MRNLKEYVQNNQASQGERKDYSPNNQNDKGENDKRDQQRSPRDRSLDLDSQNLVRVINAIARGPTSENSHSTQKNNQTLLEEDNSTQ